jgi:hypothetical protein
MIRSIIKLLFSFIMVFSLMAPTIAPFCIKDGDKMVMMGGNNEEEQQQDNIPETLKKLGEKDLIFYEMPFISLQTIEHQVHNFNYWILSETIVSDIPLPPPEYTA